MSPCVDEEIAEVNWLVRTRTLGTIEHYETRLQNVLGRGST